jgi:hypothetical protein
MVSEPRLDNSAPWKQRFRAPVIASTQIARLAPTRGLAMSNRSGIYQLYTWDVPTGKLQQLTDRFEGLLYGVILPMDATSIVLQIPRVTRLVITCGYLRRRRS